MPKRRYSPEEITGKLREADVLISQGKKVVEVIKALGGTDVTYYRWRQEDGGLPVSERRVGRVLLGHYRSPQRHVAVVKSDEDALMRAIVQLASQYGRCG